MLIDEIIEFLRTVPPFNFLGEKELAEIAGEVSFEYYPRGIRILEQNGPPAEYLRLIKKGGVRVFMISDEGDEITIDFRSEGEQFGIVSMVSGDRSRANVMAVEDTICYLIPRARVLGLLGRNPQVNEYFLKSFFLNFIDKTYEETRKNRLLVGEAERVLFTTPVRDILGRKPVTADEGITIKEAAAVMAGERISSLVLVNGSEVPAGIITDRDLREKVVARGRDTDDPVTSIMSTTLIRADAGEFCFEALLKMIRYNIHHLIVVERGALKGVVTNHDFMVLQGSSPMVFVKAVEKAQGIDELKAAREKLVKVVDELLREGARAGNITGLITELTEKFLLKAADIVERKLGESPAEYSMFLYGDGGRREFTLDIRPRLGVVFDDSAGPVVADRTQKYLDEYCRVFAETLNACGFAEALGCMTPRSVMGAGAWRESFERWAAEPFAHEMDEGLFDMRPIMGKDSVVIDLREHLRDLTSGSEEIMDWLASRTVENRPPLGFFKRFVVEKSGEHRNELDLLEKGIRPLVDSVKLFSLEKRISEISTLKRLNALKERHGFEHAEDASQALEYLFTLVIHDQLAKSEKGISPDSFLNPERLTNLERKTLKETFVLITNLYDIIEKGYRTERVGG